MIQILLSIPKLVSTKAEFSPFFKKRGQSSAFFIFTKAKYHMPKKNRRHLNTVLCVCSSGSFSTVAPKTRCCLLFLFFEEAV